MELSRWSNSQAIPRRMPVLDAYVEGALGEDFTRTLPLEGWTVIFIQHQKGNHAPQAEAILRVGVRPRDLFWLDIPYSSHPRVREAVQAMGVPRANFISHRYSVLSPYAPYQLSRMATLYKRLLDRPPERLLVLDDGAYFLEAASCFARSLPRVAIVEQTTRGFIKMTERLSLRAAAARVPVVDVARSQPKRTLEPPFIGKAVCASLGRRAKPLLPVSSRTRCLILGYGAIGRRVAAFVGQEFGLPRSRITVLEPIGQRRKAAAEAGFDVCTHLQEKQRFHLVIGCSGRRSFGVGDYTALADGAVLASASSGAVELSRRDFIDLANASRFDDIEVKVRGQDGFNVHSDLRVRFPGCTTTFLNGGFPINFDRAINCIPAHYIQPTPTMMVAGAIQAARAGAPGVHRLSVKFSRWLDEEFRGVLGRESAFLETA